jgi:hypothetical protein
LRLIHQIVEARLRTLYADVRHRHGPALFVSQFFVFGEYQPASWLSFLEIDQPLAEQRG